MPVRHRLLLFTKPARPGRVKTRLIGDLTAEQAAELHSAFVGDVLDRLQGREFELNVAWALDDGEAIPGDPPGGVRQVGVSLGDRLFNALNEGAADAAAVAAFGSDHPTISVAAVDEAFARIEGGADLVIGPAVDGGYYLIALAASAVRRELFEGIAWSTDQVLAQTLERAREAGLDCQLLEVGRDVDTPEDLLALAQTLAVEDHGCPRTRSLLAAWGRLRRPDSDSASDPETAVVSARRLP